MGGLCPLPPLQIKNCMLKVHAGKNYYAHSSFYLLILYSFIHATLRALHGKKHLKSSSYPGLDL